MEGLIKGLADVAFGGGDERRGGDDERDERPRSTWANVCPISFMLCYILLLLLNCVSDDLDLEMVAGGFR